MEVGGENLQNERVRRCGETEARGALKKPDVP